MKTNKLALLALSAVIAVAACGSDDDTNKKDAAAKPDGGKDTGADTKPAPDTGGGPDTAPAADGPVDTRLDTAPDTAPDATKPDTAPDVTPDALIKQDAPPDTTPTPDVAPDTGPTPDGGVDAGPDGGPTEAGADGAGDALADAAPVVACTPLGTNCAPQLGLQIDRMGRAGVNTALTDPFWDDGVQALADHKVKQDKYNQASDPATWGDVELAPGKKTKDLIKGALAAYDSLDGTSDGVMAGDGCGTQLAYDATYKGTHFTDYNLLTTVLVDDRLYVNTGSGSCHTYLGVEANELGKTNSDCGGRTPTYNTIDVTYTALVTGGLDSPSCSTACDVTNGVPADFDKGAGYSESTFPFLGAPIP